MQNVTAENIFVSSNDRTMLELLANAKQYGAIQNYVEETMTRIKELHPLYPTFSAKYNARLNKLVSNPETKDALEKYPKIIKGKFTIDYSKYPNMDKREDPWDYAYRMQERVELNTTEYKEYLGEKEDPFPTVKYEEGMITCIMPPEFPEAVDADLVSGTEAIHIKLRRKPCQEYGVIMLGNVSGGHGFDFNIIIRDEKDDVRIKITKVSDCDLKVQLSREKFIKAIYDTRNIKIIVEGKKLVNAEIDNEYELSADMFKVAPTLVTYLESLLTIQEHTGCRFSNKITTVSKEDYEIAILLAKSLTKQWFLKRMNFDNIVRCDYNKISSDVIEQEETYMGADVDIIEDIQLQGVSFSAQKYKIIYTDVKINNIEKVKKNIARKRKKILITIRPCEGEDTFNRYSMIEGIEVSH